MSISLTPQLEDLINRKVAAGLYDSPSDVVRDALKLLEERDRVREQQAAELRRQVQIGIDEIERGEGIPGEKVFEELRLRSEQKRRGV